MAEISKLYQLLDHSADRFPEQTAVICGEEALTYSQLHARAAKLARELNAAGIGGQSRVALCCPKSLTSLSSLFGILKAGAAYLPVDLTAPVERNRFILGDCGVAALILPEASFVHYQDRFSILSSLTDGLVLARNNSAPLSPSPEDLAYVLYTSGSTGVPKGVMYSNRGALDFINWCSDTFSPSPSDRFSSHAPFHFDLSVFDIFVCLKHGASLILIREEISKQPLLLAQLIAEQKITIWYSTPSALSMLSDYGKMEKYDYSSLKRVLFAGEVFPVNKFNALRRKLPGAKYYNLYGPTETNVCTWYEVPAEISSPMPIGKVCPHYEGKVLDDELLISGRGVMLGYWNSEGKIPFHQDTDGKNWYRTGDLVATDAEGNYVFRGRRDRMVKRHGYRIELDEIEMTLNRHPDITSCAVVHSVSDDSVTISAVVIVGEESRRSLIKMKEYCMRHLPSYMIPDDFIFVDELPYTSNHKIDYQKIKQNL